MILVFSTIIIICIAFLSISVGLLLALGTPADRKRAVECPFYDGGHQTSQDNLNKHKYHDLHELKYPDLYHHNFNKHKYHDLHELKYPDLYHHNLN
ncbi:hypothetical protein MTO96_035584 [Rhipicephalus appendiculatus]